MHSHIAMPSQSKSLDELISEKVKSVKPKGVRVGTQSGKIKVQRQGGQKQQNKPQQQKQQQKAHVLDRALEVKNKKIGKQHGQNQQKQRKHNPQQRVLAPPPFPVPPPELMMSMLGGMMPGADFAPLNKHMSNRLSGMRNNIAPQRGNRGRNPGPLRIRPDPDAIDKWENDMYNPVDMGLPKRGKLAGPPSVPNTRLKISNLHYNVSEKDIRELFESVGTLRAWQIDFDPDGRSLGTGTVEYFDAAIAENAVFQFNDVSLDGLKLKIEIDDGLNPPKRLGSGVKVEYGGDSVAIAKRGPGRLLAQAFQQQQAPRGMGVPKVMQRRMGRMNASDAMQE